MSTGSFHWQILGLVADIGFLANLGKKDRFQLEYEAREICLGRRVVVSESPQLSVPRWSPQNEPSPRVDPETRFHGAALMLSFFTRGPSSCPPLFAHFSIVCHWPNKVRSKVKGDAGVTSGTPELTSSSKRREDGAKLPGYIGGGLRNIGIRTSC